MKPVRELLVLFTLAFWGCISVGLAEEPITFERDVRPIFKAYCLDCHGGGEALKGRLDLRLKRFAERGGDSGPAIVAGKPEESYLLDRLHDAEMPPGEKKVPREKIEVIARWIAEGATTSRPEPKRLPPGVDITPEECAPTGRFSRSKGRIPHFFAVTTAAGRPSTLSSWPGSASTASHLRTMRINVTLSVARRST